MKPVNFKGSNCIYAEEQDEYLDLPAYKHDDEWGSVSACWKLSIYERVKILFSGHIYTTLLTFGKPLTPQRLDVDSPLKLNGERMSYATMGGELMRLWMLRIHYELGQSFGEGERNRHREYRGYRTEKEVIDLKTSALIAGIKSHGDPYTTPKKNGYFKYEYWVPPSRITGLEIIEYYAAD